LESESDSEDNVVNQTKGHDSDAELECHEEKAVTVETPIQKSLESTHAEKRYVKKHTYGCETELGRH